MRRQLQRLLLVILSLAAAFGGPGARELSSRFRQGPLAGLHHCQLLSGPDAAAPVGSDHDAGVECCPCCGPSLGLTTDVAAADVSVIRFAGGLSPSQQVPQGRPGRHIPGAHRARAPPVAG